MAAPREPDDLRASDQDRHRVAERLHAAAAEGRITLDELGERLESLYSARTYGELVPLTRDLPVDAVGRVVQPAASTVPDGVTGPSASVAIMSGCHRSGEWVVPSRHSAVALMGGVELDLRHARFTGPDTTITAVAIMGGIEITVPEHLHVEVDGIGLMGGFDGRGAGVRQGGPRVRITGVALMGGVEVKRAGPELDDTPKELRG
ncbi:DUF1707 SHOCT-like domain-containing protein [Pseudonocardia abyssalis]|uniref:DUF1707 and DUF2154 domain-containing protein n=1 Tax=Pseudonocardia abyssalis TaxID=2792008 RepID=A0ABS6USG0_9PSEU|nr:DUF1707 domain-containing protein [Pseudonocardia abyssalis]MBW0119486.1 DUF1707 and DUF2154 domain-containing protein [Pseudonocardia abyssalis]MBW0135198.1 DUF1707 and DUF2154 domain-containing protein [Pseudonocardia abyssalis]